ncbi:hypothetical protein [Polyangium sp. 6x1]|uniref:hypothetical protein n=1 Tax=Polyangium sp. 6x1 TaxID=3042689 RepID=UPI0024822EC9|nr:hypothetical protein [Polyangium sp. 6x1]MDI1451099.1 hypothetical protein [Polyangium sp. 6x1]
MATRRRVGGLVLTALVVWAGGCLELETGSETPSPDGGTACQPADETDASSGDCVKIACVDGALREVADDDDVPDDGNGCTTDTCENALPKHENKAAGEACGMGSTCDGSGHCSCTVKVDCGAGTACQQWQCESGICKSINAPKGTKVADEVAGDCRSVQCNGMGGTEEVLDPTDPQSDGNGCTVDTCVGGMTTHAAAPARTLCPTADNPTGMGKCDGAGSCFGCTQTVDCGGGPPWHTCDTTANVCFSCEDGAQNGVETDVDCGGECFNRCVRGQKCLVTYDCEGECDNGVCVDCFDNVKNGTEGDKDCGGKCAQKCATDATCNVAADCTNGVCTGGKCAAASCSDTVQNGGETDVDCGGPCLDCPAGKKCNGNNDCINECINGICN